MSGADDAPPGDLAAAVARVAPWLAQYNTSGEARCPNGCGRGEYHRVDPEELPHDPECPLGALWEARRRHLYHARQLEAAYEAAVASVGEARWKPHEGDIAWYEEGVPRGYNPWNIIVQVHYGAVGDFILRCYEGLPALLGWRR